ncbi:MAG: GNAT family N-acetyltransferase [Candidatus Diapherotrites archaeon]|uniref:GNAT family N-acetyltransferase n=1 Tax=Candidatus Iainarchaeum sp. TaxID=3101447 RepID=A0A8T3YL97_9ARCH|nr:GNAT family N-acetyltransferase [Candidatus Diapherotrites archaeon]
MKLHCKRVQTVPEFVDSVRLRVDVFIKEQGFAPGWEPDEDDKDAEHFIALADGKVVATARCREAAKGEFKIERMATRKEMRGRGAATKLLEFMLKDIMKRNPEKIWLRSQEQARGFYEKNGFRVMGGPFEVYGKMHVDMEYKAIKAGAKSS